MNGVLSGAKRSDGLNPEYYPFSPTKDAVDRAKFSLDDFDVGDKAALLSSSADQYADLVFRKRILKLKSNKLVLVKAFCIHSFF